MIVALTLTLFAGLAQSPMAPEGVEPYVFVFSSDPNTEVFALVNTAHLPKSRFLVYKEEPWLRRLTPMEIVKHRLSESYPEDKFTYRSRMKAEWLAHSATQIGESKDSPWLLNSEYDLMKRATVLSLPPAFEENLESVASPQGAPVTVNTVEVGMLAQWWLHGLIVIGTLIAIVLVIRWGFFSQVWLGVDL